MTYEIKINIEIAGIRRSVRLMFGYHIERIKGEKQLIYESITMLDDERQVSAEWIYLLLGPRQRKEIESNLLKHGEAAKAA